jgi:redox-sensing transcriptional repressor
MGLKDKKRKFFLLINFFYKKILTIPYPNCMLYASFMRKKSQLINRIPIAPGINSTFISKHSYAKSLNRHSVQSVNDFSEKEINGNSVYRLLQYRTALLHMKDLGFSSLSSEYLAQSVGTNSSQVRKDLSIYKICGKKRGGYDLQEVIDSINHIFDKTKTCKAIIVGAGNLGTALMRYKGPEVERFSMVAAFDIDPTKYKNNSPFPTFPLNKLQEIVEQNGVEFAIICVPAIAAQGVLDLLIRIGIKGILNFALCSLTYDPTRVVVKNVNIANELEMLAYYVNQKSSITVQQINTNLTGVLNESMRQLQV